MTTPQNDPGLSPRGRGKRLRIQRHIQPARSIPAWAGETIPVTTGRSVCGVYPRVGGGNSCRKTRRRRALGLSPRGRGKHDPTAARQLVKGSIPAWAGETGGKPCNGLKRPVYPRVGGGNVADKKSPARPAVYPRVGGGNAIAPARSALALGLSPRGRGKPAGSKSSVARCGSIPAWAGETAALAGGIVLARVYPRVGGGNVDIQRQHPDGVGLSPRGRGKQDGGDLPGSR